MLHRLLPTAHIHVLEIVHGLLPTRKVDVRLPGKGNSNSHGARPVHLIITMMKWIRTSRLSTKNSLSLPQTASVRSLQPGVSRNAAFWTRRVCLTPRACPSIARLVLERLRVGGNHPGDTTRLLPTAHILVLARKVDVRLPGKGNSNSHGARPVHPIITTIKWIRTSRLSIKNSLSSRPRNRPRSQLCHARLHG